MSKQVIPPTNRRRFLRTAATAAAAFTIVPRHVLGGVGYKAPSDTVNIAAIGAGGKANGSIPQLASENIVALCDVDSSMAKELRTQFPKAAFEKDYRVMMEKYGKDIDAVVVTVPDHTHAPAGLLAMSMDKHVYIEKPLARTISEVRALTEMAKSKPQLITQMGNQGASGEGIRRTQELVESGLIGDVHTVYAWTDRPIWPQGGRLPQGTDAIPADFDWNLWLGTAAMRPHNNAYHPFAWRGYWDFGTGALGDMGCHIIDTPFYILELGYPTSAEASVVQVFSQNWNADYLPETCPPASKVHIKFPARGEKPPVELIWTDGGIRPGTPEELTVEQSLRPNGIIMVGDKGKLMADVYGADPILLPTSRMDEINVPQTIARVETSHEMDWVNGIKNNYQPSSHLAKAGPLTETILMGNLAVRGYDYRFPQEVVKEGDREYAVLGRTRLNWDGEAMKVTNVDAMNEFVSPQSMREF